MDFDESTVNVNKQKIKIKSKKNNKGKSMDKRKKHHVARNDRNSVFRNNYKHYQYDYEEDFYEPY
ncbi:MAG: hypothetical protein SOT71_05175 [Romboutsia timonensis]|uniref:hypothetical protein n=1 Tax=Romboutsia timonensis TaxID=1776391 RepID=UPI002A75390E|nr:hypothetical protein [Romboutsia timonensis]MDY2882026.1 hypothetical protein [Romboutsia timonensis]